MKELIEQWVRNHSTLQVLCRTGLGVEGSIISYDEVWLHIKQVNGVQTLIRCDDITMIHKPTEIQMVSKATNPLKIS